MERIGKGRMLAIAIYFIAGFAEAQTTEQLERLTQSSTTDAETQLADGLEESYLAQLDHLSSNKINLNEANEQELLELGILSSLQVDCFFRHRAVLGSLVSIYELQAIPFWDIQTIRRLLPYVSLRPTGSAIAGVLKRFSGGQHNLLLRLSEAGNVRTGSASYMGSPLQCLWRYEYRYKNSLQMGVLGEKDAGEPFFKGAQKAGFDFYSMHFFVRNVGVIKSLALGDYTVNIAQGLTQWQSLFARKTADVMRIKQQAEIIRPYRSTGEFNFHRGAAVTFGWGRLSLTTYFSIKNVDANVVVDSAFPKAGYVTSLPISGLHRTESEWNDKGRLRQLGTGANLSFRTARHKIGVSAVCYRFNLPLKKGNRPDQYFSFEENKAVNYSLEAACTFRNFHFFGEGALDRNGRPACVAGLMAALDPKADVALHYRHFAASFQPVNSGVFSETGRAVNEEGLYVGICLRPSNSWRLDLYGDIYRFPWLRFQTVSPSRGRDYLLQATYRPSKKLEMYVRIHRQSKAGTDGQGRLESTRKVPVLNVRCHLTFQMSTSWTFRNRFEYVSWDGKSSQSQQGFMAYADLLYRPMMKKLSGNLRLQVFETDGYNSRIYAFENDVLYGYSIPYNAGRGVRYCLNVSYDLSKQCSFWVKIARNVPLKSASKYPENQAQQGTEVKFQIRYCINRSKLDG